MPYTLEVTETKRSKIAAGNTLDEILGVIEAVGPDNFNKKDAKTLLAQTGSYSFSHGGKMVRIQWHSHAVIAADFKGQ